MAITLLINYARSGGTILSKCLAAMPDVVLLSEVHPQKCAITSVKEQALAWYNIELISDNYLEAVLELHEICQEKNKHLVIRDWTFYDFTPHAINEFKAAKRFQALELLQEKIEIKPIAFVRDAIDIWISRWKPPHFFPHYESYIEILLDSKIPIFKYENFCQDTKKTIKSICKAGFIPYSPAYKNYPVQKNVTGDNTSGYLSRGKSNVIIQNLKRRQLSLGEIKSLQRNKSMQISNQLLGYPADYYQSELEDSSGFFLLELKCWVGKIRGAKAKDLY